jgi:hypothetical protein
VSLDLTGVLDGLLQPRLRAYGLPRPTRKNRIEQHLPAHSEHCAEYCAEYY